MGKIVMKTLLFKFFSPELFFENVSPHGVSFINTLIFIFSMNPQEWDFSKIKQNLISPDKFVQSFFLGEK